MALAGAARVADIRREMVQLHDEPPPSLPRGALAGESGSAWLRCAGWALAGAAFGVVVAHCSLPRSLVCSHE